jgi:hypothetical protein
MKRNNNKNNKNRKNKQTRRSKAYSKAKLPALMAYPLDINAFYTMDGTTPGVANFSYSISQGIYDSAFYQAYADKFQEFKIVYTEICVAPRQVNGTQPPEGYMMVLVNEYMAVQYSEMPYLQGVTKIHGHGVTRMYFKSKGRNDDLNRWYNVISDKPNFDLKVHFTANIYQRTEGPHYIVTVRSRLLFRRPIIKQTNKIPEEFKTLKAENSQCESTIKTGSKETQVRESFDDLTEN